MRASGCHQFRVATRLEETMSNTAEIEAVLFKPAVGGYVFQAPNPWVFGPTSSYIVSATQKAELLGIIRPRRPVLYFAGIVIGILLWAGVVATAMWVVSGHDQPTTADFGIMSVVILAPIYLAWVTKLQGNLRRMQPIIATAPRTGERIGQREMRQAMANAMSLKRTLLIGALWSFSCLTQVFTLALRNARHPLFGDVQSYVSLFTAVVAAGLAAYYLYLALRKTRERRAAI
jgi:hypothetical protein